MRFLLGNLLAVRGIERAEGNGSRRWLPQARQDDRVAEKLDGHATQLSRVEGELAALADGNRREHEALAMIAGEFRRLREEEQALRRQQVQSLEVAAVALTRLSEGIDLDALTSDREVTEGLRAELEAHRGELHAREEEVRGLRAVVARRDAELQELRDANGRAAEELYALRESHRRTDEELATLRETHDRTDEDLQAVRESHTRTREELQALRDTHARTDEDLQALRETHRRATEELAATREEGDRTSRRLASSHAKVRRLREELEIARMPWWRRRKAQAARE